MTALSNEDVVRQYLEAHRVHDFEALGRLRAPAWYQEWPQTRERVRGHENDATIMRNWPGGLPTANDDQRVTGSEDRYVLTPSWTYQRIAGSGDSWWAEGTGRYPDGSTWHAVILAEVHDGTIHRETWYFAPPLPAPEWRSQWVEYMGPLEQSDER
jgi:hypothetical protein